MISFTKAGKALNYLSNIDELQNDLSLVPVFIFLDLNMPLINGFQFIEIYEKLSTYIRTNCKIVILTSSLNKNDETKFANNKNVIAFLHKPLLNSNIVELMELKNENLNKIK